MKRYAWLILLFSLPILCEAGTVRSREGTFTATVVAGSANSGKRPGTATWTVRVAGADGVERYVVEKDVPYGSPFPGVEVCDNGRVIVVDAFAGFVEFIDETGTLSRTWRPFGDAGPDHERILKCSAAGGGAAFLLSGEAGTRAIVVATTIPGREMWRKDLGNRMGSEVYLAPDGSGIVASSYSTGDGFRFLTEVLDAEGKDLRAMPMLMRHAAFDPLSGVLAIADRDSAEIFVPGRGDRQGCWRASEEGECVMGVATIGGQVAIMTAHVTAGASGTDIARPTVVIVGTKGEELHRVPVGHLSGRGLSIRTESGEFVVANELELIAIPVIILK